MKACIFVCIYFQITDALSSDTQSYFYCVEINMNWNKLPDEVIKLIWYHRSLLMAESLLAREISSNRTIFRSEQLKHIHWAYTLLRPNPRYDAPIQSILTAHDTWVHYYH